ncbi:MAG: hypothetical protein KC910_30570, partial [Candidatus Eremiobacteraeota bacterium]|nr:hypothetical protein [Candidatus Eremiobacteraeota bacterium]
MKVELPDGFQMRNREGPDFDFYEIYNGSRVFLALFVGSHPSFPHEHIDGSESAYFDVCIDDAELRRKVHDAPLQQVRILSEWKDGRLVHRELLARYSLGAGWPKYIHAITPRYLTQEELQVADRLLFSLQ